MADELFIGVDSGTQGVKVVVLSSETGAVLSEGRASHDIIENNAGRREQEPTWWTAALDAAMDQALHAPGVDPKAVAAMGVSGQQHGFVPLDADGAVIRPAKLWCDTETAPQCATITERLGGEDAVIALIGNAVAAGFTASKILWLKENEPENYAKLACALLPHDYLNYYLTGEKKTECGDASGTAYFDIRKREWSLAVLSAIDQSGKLEGCLPECVASDAPVGVVRPEIAARFGLSREVLVSSGGGDNMMAAIGTGNAVPGMVTASFGTSGTIFAHSASPVSDPKGELAGFCSSDGAWLPLACTMNVTVSTELTRELLELDLAAFNGLAAKAPEGADGVRLIPFFNGERTPALPGGKGVFYGLTSANFTRENVCRASMEGATLGLRYGLDVMRRLGVAPKEMRLVGGGAKSPLWRKIAANVFDCPVVCPEITEAGALGAAIQAAWAYAHARGEDVSLPDLCARFVRLDEKSRVEPDAVSVSRYHAVYAEYIEIQETLKERFKK